MTQHVFSSEGFRENKNLFFSAKLLIERCSSKELSLARFLEHKLYLSDVKTL
jgi:hypothetical protein